MGQQHGSIAFIGGGNMASAIIGGLVRGLRDGQGRQDGNGARDPASIIVVEPFEEARWRLQQQFGVQAQAAADERLANAATVVWAVKPQLFAAAAAPCAPHVAGALHVSVMAGVRSDTIVRASGSQAVVRCMPNTPALIGRGIAGLFARHVVTHAQRAEVDALLAPTGQTIWLTEEAQLDAVTAVSGSGPAYVFYVLEALIQAATELGLSAEQGRQLALATFDGATALAAGSSDSPETLRAHVTSKGGTTHAAISALERDGVKAAFVQALHAAANRAAELGVSG